MMKRPILLYLRPFVPVLTELANEAARGLIENRFAESLLGASQFSSLVPPETNDSLYYLVAAFKNA
jgi:hypothetical protein